MTSPVRRVPIESAQPMVVFALARLLVAVSALVLVLILGLPYEGRMATVLAVVAVPWSLFNLWLARRAPERAMNPLIAAGDMVVLAIIESVSPEIYGAARFMALFFLAVHAHFQGERIGLLLGVFAAVVLVVPTAVQSDAPVEGDLLVFWEGAFVAAVLGTVLLVGRFRTFESTSRLRARELSRRTLRAEHEIRRRVSESLHDGPVQELISVNLVLGAASAAAAAEDQTRASELIEDARTAVAQSVDGLREEMLDLGPYAYEEFSFASAIERCLPVWKRRYSLDATFEAAALDLPSELEGELFRIVQESVSNAARHGTASHVDVSLSSRDGELLLVVSDDGEGFGERSPLAPSTPGHIGLASMRERAELLDGELVIDSSEEGTTVTVRAPLPRRGSRRLGR